MPKFLKPWIPYLLLAILTFFTTNINYHLGDQNHLEQLPFIFAKQDSSYLNRDFFVNYAREIGPRYYYTQFITPLTQIFSLEYTFYFLTYLSNYLIFLVTYFFLKTFTKNRYTIFFLAFLLGHAQFGSLGQASAITDNYLIPQHLATPLILGAYLFSLKANFIPTYLLTLLVIPLQPSLALVSALPIAANLIINHKSNKKIFLVGAYLLSIVALIYALFLRFQKTTMDSNLYIYILAHLRHPHHYIPSRFDPIDYMGFTLLMAALIFSLAYLYKSHKNQNIYRSVLASVALSSLLCLGGFIFAEVVPIKAVIELQAFRIVYLLRWLSFTLTTAVIFDISYKKLSSQTASLIWLTFAVIIALYWPGKTLQAIPNLSIKYESDRTGLYQFISQNTNQNDLFLTPPDFGSMRVVPKRAIVVDWKSFPFNQNSTAIWYERVKDVYQLSDHENNYAKLTDSRILELKQKYNFEYAVLYSKTPTTQKTVYQDAAYKLIKLN